MQKRPVEVVVISDLQLGNFQLADKVVIEINGRMTWIFHGDVFDHTSKNTAKFWGKLGSNGYALLLGFNKCINAILHRFGRNKVSLSRKLMEQFHKRVVKIEAFEESELKPEKAKMEKPKADVLTDEVAMFMHTLR